MFLGIDVGTSAVKAVLMDESGAVVATADAALAVSSPHPGWSEQNPNDWWDATITACAMLREDNPQAWKALAAIGLSGQMHGAVLLDAAQQILRPAILWNDGRAQPQCTELATAIAEIGQIAGVPPMPGFTAPKLMWVQQNEPEVHAKISHILLPKDYVRLRLTSELATDMADAAGTMWLDQQNRSWSDEVCVASATEPGWLPRLHEGTEVSGKITRQAAEELDLSPAIPVAAGGGDAAAGAMGIGAVEDGDAFISLGTSGQLFVSTADYRPNPESAVHAYAHCVPDRWFQMAAMLNGASPMAWFAGVAGADIGTLLEEAAAADPVRAPLFLPYLTGERTPHNDTSIRGAFYGLEPATDRGAMMRAVVDAIAYSFCDASDALASAGTAIERPFAIGGGTRGDLVLQTLSDALGIKIVRSMGAETGPALGAARLAAVASGAMRLSEAAVKPEAGETFSPTASETERHAERLARYRTLYGALAPLS